MITSLLPGLLYVPDILSLEDEASLLPQLRELDFAPIEMRGQVARRRTVHFGWVYGYESWKIAPGPPLPAFLEPLRERVAELAGVETGALAEALLTEYPASAGIGWHRDAPQFGVVVGSVAAQRLPDALPARHGAARETRRARARPTLGLRARRRGALAVAAQHPADEEPALLRDLPHATRAP